MKTSLLYRKNADLVSTLSSKGSQNTSTDLFFQKGTGKKWNLKKQPLTELLWGTSLYWSWCKGSMLSCVCAFVPYLADFGWCKNHVEDAWPASNHSCGDCIGQCYHQEPQIAERDIKHVNHKKTNYIILYIIQPPDRNFSTFVESINVILGKRKRFETKSVYSMY